MPIIIVLVIYILHNERYVNNDADWNNCDI